MVDNKIRRTGLALSIATALACTASTAFAQTAAPVTPTPAPDRSPALATVSHVAVAVGAVTQLVMPRVYYADNDETIGWKARWHVSVLAPVMTMTTLTLVSEYGIEPRLKKPRPGCDDTNAGGPGCTTYGMPSTHSEAAFGAFGHGTAIFLVDTLKWNNGRLNAPSLVVNVVVPFVAALVAGIARGAGSPAYEGTGQVLLGAGAGFGAGLITGGVYSLMQRPGCPYGSGVVCW